MPPMEPVAGPDLLDGAIDLARRAGELLLRYFAGAPTGVGAKSTPTDLVSDADRASEDLLMTLIGASHPDDGILGEESEPRRTASGRTWTIDPLDGTVNFLYGLPWWAVSVGLADEEGDALGVVHVPVLDETFAAARGRGATLNGDAIAVSERAGLDRALIATGFAYDTRARARQGEVAARVLPRVRDIRRMGSAAIDLCSVACGRVDGFYEAHLEEWDKAAGRLIVKEAGGIVEEIEPPLEGMSPGLIASTPGIHDELRRLITDGHS